MFRVLIRTIGISCLVVGLFITGSGQTVDQFKVTSSGIAPIMMTFDSIPTDQIYIGAMEEINAFCNGHCSISEDVNKSIKWRLLIRTLSQLWKDLLLLILI